MSIALNSMRANQDYVLTNYGEKYEFTVVTILSNTEFELRDINSLDIYKMSELIGQGKGKDFSLWER